MRQVHPIGVERTGNARLLCDRSGKVVLPGATYRNGGWAKTFQNCEADARDYEGQVERLRELGAELSGRQALLILIEAMPDSQLSNVADYLRSLLSENPSGAAP